MTGTAVDYMRCHHCGRPMRHWQADVSVGGKSYTLLREGYGEDCITGYKSCFACCAELDLLRMVTYGKATLYLTNPLPKMYQVTNWPNTLQLQVTEYRKSVYRTPTGGRVERVDFWFCGPDGHRWYGVNQGDNQIARCRRTKQIIGPAFAG